MLNFFPNFSSHFFLLNLPRVLLIFTRNKNTRPPATVFSLRLSANASACIVLVRCAREVITPLNSPKPYLMLCINRCHVGVVKRTLLRNTKTKSRVDKQLIQLRFHFSQLQLCVNRLNLDTRLHNDSKVFK